MLVLLLAAMMWNLSKGEHLLWNRITPRMDEMPRKPGINHLDFDRQSWQDSEKFLSSTPMRVACYPDSDHT
jgi:hypothetical protein